MKVVHKLQSYHRRKSTNRHFGTKRIKKSTSVTKGEKTATKNTEYCSSNFKKYIKIIIFLSDRKGSLFCPICNKELQDHSIIYQKWLSHFCWSNPRSKQGELRKQSCSCCPLKFSASPSRDFTAPFGILFPCLNTFTVNFFFLLAFSCNFLHCSLYQSSLFRHRASLRSVWLCSPYPPVSRRKHLFSAFPSLGQQTQFSASFCASSD